MVIYTRYLLCSTEKDVETRKLTNVAFKGMGRTRTEQGSVNHFSSYIYSCMLSNYCMKKAWSKKKTCRILWFSNGQRELSKVMTRPLSSLKDHRDQSMFPVVRNGKYSYLWKRPKGWFEKLQAGQTPLVPKKGEVWGHSDHIFKHVKEKNMTRNSHYGSRVNHVWATQYPSRIKWFHLWIKERSCISCHMPWA